MRRKQERQGPNRAIYAFSDALQKKSYFFTFDCKPAIAIFWKYGIVIANGAVAEWPKASVC